MGETLGSGLGARTFGSLQEEEAHLQSTAERRTGLTDKAEATRRVANIAMRSRAPGSEAQAGKGNEGLGNFSSLAAEEAYLNRNRASDRNSDGLR